MNKNKLIFNACLRVILPVLIVLTILIMALTYLKVWKSCNTVSASDKETSESGELIKLALLQAEDSGKYYEVFAVSDTAEIIAFCIPDGHLYEIPSMAGSYYPVAYWQGQYQTMDLSQGFAFLEDRRYECRYYLNEDPQLSQVNVYDFSAYKGHTQQMGRGPGIALVFLWLAELMVSGVLILMDLVGGFIIFGINRNRKKNL